MSASSDAIFIDSCSTHDGEWRTIAMGAIAASAILLALNITLFFIYKRVHHKFAQLSTQSSFNRHAETLSTISEEQDNRSISSRDDVGTALNEVGAMLRDLEQEHSTAPTPTPSHFSRSFSSVGNLSMATTTTETLDLSSMNDFNPAGFAPGSDTPGPRPLNSVSLDDAGEWLMCAQSKLKQFRK
eukprot:m.77801 g.77801  ORF g.77801 m.77801 type:complete len:185 (-) comp14485_c0_seq1:174-728(-)